MEKVFLDCVLDIDELVLQLLGVNYVVDLISLVDIGYVEGIEVKFDELSEELCNCVLVDNLKGYLQWFDFDSYKDVLRGLEVYDG